MDLSDFYKVIGELYVNIKVINENVAKEINALKADVETKDKEIEQLKGEILLLTKGKSKLGGTANGSVET